MATDPRLTNLSYGFYIARVRFSRVPTCLTNVAALTNVLEKQYLLSQQNKL